MEPERKRKMLGGLCKIARGLMGKGIATEQNVIDKVRECIKEQLPEALSAFEELKNELRRNVIPHTRKEINEPYERHN
jgi:hypothetical protein